MAVCEAFDKLGVKYEYETLRVTYFPKKARFYKPDLILPNGIILELKGEFQTSDRTKHLAVREDNPDLDIRFVFSNPNNRLNKQSKTTYAMWCETHAFKFCAASSFTRSWLSEPPNVASLAAIAKLKESKKK